MDNYAFRAYIVIRNITQFPSVSIQPAAQRLIVTFGTSQCILKIFAKQPGFDYIKQNGDTLAKSNFHPKQEENRCKWHYERWARCLNNLLSSCFRPTMQGQVFIALMCFLMSGLFHSVRCTQKCWKGQWGLRTVQGTRESPSRMYSSTLGKFLKYDTCLVDIDIQLCEIIFENGPLFGWFRPLHSVHRKNNLGICFCFCFMIRPVR